MTAPLLLTAYGMPHSIGLLPTLSGENHPRPISYLQLVSIAKSWGLDGVETPLPASISDDDSLKTALTDQNLSVVTDSMVLVETPVDEFDVFLRRSANLGAKTVRTLLSRLLCGDRRGFPGGWDARLMESAQRLKTLLPLAADLGVTVVVENHQDATTEDLLRLVNMVGHPNFGICFDTGNPLSVGQEPVDAARKLASVIRHVHLKDYTIHFAPNGYRLVRCVAGSGVIDFPAIVDLLNMQGTSVTFGVEVAAQATRTIPVLETGWWEPHAPLMASEFAGALRILWSKGIAMNVPYSSAWERGEGSDAVNQEEWNVARASADYFTGMWGYE